MRLLNTFAVAACLVSGISMAEEKSEPQPPAPQQTVPASHEETQAEKVGTPTQTNGKVTSIHNVKLVGIADPHVLAKIQTEQGDTDIVDLGSAEDLKSNGIEPREGQQLWVSGRVGRINDKELLVAENLSESKLVTITRTAPLRKESEKHAAARGADTTPTTDGKDAAAAKDGNAEKDSKVASSAKDHKEPKTETVDAGMLVKTVEGTVMHTRQIKIEGEAEEHTFVKLQTDDGIVVVDLGTAAALPKVDLNEGQAIAATGYVGHLNTKPIIIADSVGNMISLNQNASTEPTSKTEPANNNTAPANNSSNNNTAPSNNSTAPCNE